MDKDILEFCKKYKITAIKTIEKWKKNCASDDWQEKLILDPYKLMDVYGIGFLRADNIALKLGIEKDSPKRIESFVTYALDEMTKGSTILELYKVFDYMQEKLEINDRNKIIDVIFKNQNQRYKLLNQKCKVTKEGYDALFITKNDWYNVERNLYNLIVSTSKMPKFNMSIEIIDNYINDLPFKLNEGQLKALNEILNNNLNILTGYGGTGKSFMTKCVLDILKLHNQTFTCLTPTGIASKVFTESTKYESMTIHRMYFSQEQITTDWIVLDECSMLSVEHFKMLLEMLTDKVRILMIGDINQLQPIAPGCSFRDIINLINKNIVKGNISTLTQIMRASNDTFIPYLCKEFTNNEKYNKVHEKENNPNVFYYPMLFNINKQLVSILKEHKLDFKDTYILSPQNKGDYGTFIINGYMDNVYANDVIYDDGYRTLRKGSICMNIKNNPSKDIYNGERLICIDDLGDSILFETIDDGRPIIYSKDEIPSFIQLSYALSCHKVQGITAKNVIFIASKQHYYMLNKNLVYTGLSRASKKLIIIYDENILTIANNKKTLDDRKTFLNEILKIHR